MVVALTPQNGHCGSPWPISMTRLTRKSGAEFVQSLAATGMRSTLRKARENLKRRLRDSTADATPWQLGPNIVDESPRRIYDISEQDHIWSGLEVCSQNTRKWPFTWPSASDTRSGD